MQETRSKKALFLIKLETWQEVALIMTTNIKACFCQNSIMSSLDQGRRKVYKYRGEELSKAFWRRKTRRCSFYSCQNLRGPLPPGSDGPVRWMGDGWNKCGLLIILHHTLLTMQWIEILFKRKFSFFIHLNFNCASSSVKMKFGFIKKDFFYLGNEGQPCPF